MLRVPQYRYIAIAPSCMLRVMQGRREVDTMAVEVCDDCGGIRPDDLAIGKREARTNVVVARRMMTS